MSSRGVLRVQCFDVGHGDSIVIEFPERDSIGVIDCCKNKGDRTRRYIRRRYEEARALGGELIVEFLCLTHPHLDHYSGFANLLDELLERRITVCELWDFGASSQTAAALSQWAIAPEQWKEFRAFTLFFKKWRRDFAHVNRTILQATPGQTRTIGGIEIEVLAPDQDHMTAYYAYLAMGDAGTRKRAAFLKSANGAWNHNLISSALLLRFDAFRIVSGGDLTNAAWSTILNRRPDVETKEEC